ncbi:MAG: aldehyde oxidase and xanthine dehydrogenase molybdopterin binding protein [Conexibacter sp.]|nr:aldehyde oxidase and xanthine dehydrogenase molybdopterin binding protein [Conexibacter sp.]
MSATVAGGRAIGTPTDRIEGREKVTGAARYAFEHAPENAAYAWIVQSPVAKGEIHSVDGSAALERPGVIAVVSVENAPRLAAVEEAELHVLQSRTISYRGQIVAVVVADSLEAAREAAAHVRVDYREQEHHVLLDEHDPAIYDPGRVNAGYPADSILGDVDAALAQAAAQVDVVYRTPAFHNNAMEPHATVASWDGDELTLYDSNQGASRVRDVIADVFELAPEQVRVISPHVGGAFGSKGTPRPHVVLAALAARMTQRPVKLAVTRQQMFAFTGYRTPTIQRLRLGAGADGRLTAIVHEAIHQSSRLREFTEQTTIATRQMYAAPNRRSTHRLARLDVPTPSWMRAPGETPGMYGLESAIDELAVELGIDPVELRIRNEPELDPERGVPFSSRNLVACLRLGAERFGWEERDPTPAVRRDGRWLVGTGVAASTYPAYRSPATATARANADGTFVVRIAGSDIGTGGRTALTLIAADALERPLERVRVEIGDSALPRAGLAGGSMATASWGTAVTFACRALLEQLQEHDGTVPAEGLEAFADSTDDVRATDQGYSRHAYGAQFAEVRVDADTGEARVSRLLGIFAAGRIINPKTARSQFIGGMTMGISMALLEESVMDREFGDYLNHDLAGYHIAAHADIGALEADWIEEDDAHLNPMGSKGIGEIGIVGTAAAVGNAVHHATGVRVRELPLRLDRLLAST